MKNPQRVFAVLGPTASGKSDFSVDLALRLNSEVVSADARQFYGEMSIGTARPGIDEQRGVPHHFVGSHSIAQPLSAGAFAREALPVLEALLAKGKPPIVTGGSGLYVKALLEGLDDLPKDHAVRDALLKRLEQHGLAALQLELQKADPKYYSEADVQNPVRVVRALELMALTGLTMHDLLGKPKSTRNFEVTKIALHWEREALYGRINARVDNMMQKGLLQEVQRLLPYRQSAALRTVGYTELFNYLDGNCSLEAAVQLIKQNTRRYAKRQLTWLRKESGVRWLAIPEWEKFIPTIT